MERVQCPRAFTLQAVPHRAPSLCAFPRLPSLLLSLLSLRVSSSRLVPPPLPQSVSGDPLGFKKEKEGSLRVPIINYMLAGHRHNTHEVLAACEVLGHFFLGAAHILMCLHIRNHLEIWLKCTFWFSRAGARLRCSYF